MLQSNIYLIKLWINDKKNFQSIFVSIYSLTKLYHLILRFALLPFTYKTSYMCCAIIQNSNLILDMTTACCFLLLYVMGLTICNKLMLIMDWWLSLHNQHPYKSLHPYCYFLKKNSSNLYFILGIVKSYFSLRDKLPSRHE